MERGYVDMEGRPSQGCCGTGRALAPLQTSEGEGLTGESEEGKRREQESERAGEWRERRERREQ